MGIVEMTSHPHIRCKSLLTATILRIFVLVCMSKAALASPHFDQCLANVQAGAFGPDGGTNNNGQPVPIGNATAITYELCVKACGTGPEPFQWSVFSQQFSAWLLPWLALISQLPFGGTDKLDNLIAMLLAIGSPTLAAYSLALTVLNARWISRLFSSCNYPNIRQVIQVLNSLQQSPIQINTNDGLLASLIVLKANDAWWSTLVSELNYTHTWSISAAAQIAWVIIAYIFTIADSFTGDMTTVFNADGQGVGSLWIWLLAIVVGWLQISPKCDAERLHKAIDRANKVAYTASESEGPPVLASRLSTDRAVSLKTGVGSPLYRDEHCTVPIYNYARFLSWTLAVEEVFDFISAASERARNHCPIVPGTPWDEDTNRTGTRVEVKNYCAPLNESSMRTRRIWGSVVFSHIFVASCIALCLQWGATGAAVIIVCTTPGGRKTILHTLAEWLSILLRRVGKIFASLNAIFILVTCIFQFSNFFNRCYCNSSVLGRGEKGWDVIVLDPEALTRMVHAWAGGVVLAAASAIGFMVFVYLYTPTLPAGKD
ncbi:hypothetical protein H0H92_002564 [Tricholoma furcatifolium]|nr:hypothetical protein H0H92_002564 [Tricholoma furcatifolium]